MDKPVIDEAFVAEVWNGNAERWANDVRAGHDRFREVYTFPAFLEFMPAIEGQRVIDLGCGGEGLKEAKDLKEHWVAEFWDTV